MKGQIFSPGKLLLTSEYTVLDGALALAVPTQLGQEFFFEEIHDSQSLIHWKAFHQNKPWLQAVINYEKEVILDANLPDSAHFILQVFRNIKALNSEKLNNNYSFYLSTNLQFPSNYGLGSSSTLMNNLADWANVDAFQLNEMSLGGSGYDVAVAKEKTPILYRNQPTRTIERIDFNPRFKEDLLFIHLNKKQDSREGIRLYRSQKKSQQLIDDFSQLTNEILAAQKIDEFSHLMTLHEEKLSTFLQIPTVKEKYFEDYGGFVKSLGAWGGDFVLASKFGDFQNYFKAKNFDVFFNWNDLII